MALSNLNKEVTTRLFIMILTNVENNENTQLSKKHVEKIKTDSSTYSQLNLIYKQIQNLQLEAKKILEEHVKTEEINDIICNFKKVPGTLYYLYIDSNNVKVLSLIEPLYDENDNIENIIYEKYLGCFYYDYDLRFKEFKK